MRLLLALGTLVLAALTGPLAATATSPAVAAVAPTATGPTPARSTVTLSIVTLSIVTLSTVTLSTVTLSTVTLSTVTLTLESDAMKAINRARTQSGCAALRVNTALRVAARRHSARMARQGTLSHRVAGEASLARRVADAGYTGAAMLGEVIALGPMTGPSAVRMWLASSMHRSILLNCRYRDVGAGVVRGGNGRYWWTVDLGRR